MSDRFRIIEVPANAPERQEALGTKEKFWYRNGELGWTLYKQGRPGTGEDWAEKIAAELAALLGLPHATYELATWRDHRGVVSPAFVPKGGILWHGNEILLASDSNYPAGRGTSRNFYRVSQHTLNLVMRFVSHESLLLPIGWDPHEGCNTPVGVFVGYLLLDAWIYSLA